MRRFLLSSLLSVCVLGQPVEEKPVQSAPPERTTDIDYYDYDEVLESSQNCSQASDLFYPLRRSENQYKRFRSEVLRHSNKQADRLMTRLTYEGGSNREFRYREFRFWAPYLDGAPVEFREFYYKEKICDFLREVYFPDTELMHSYISWGGDWPQAEELRRINREHWLSPSEKLDELLQNLMKDVVELIKPADTWPYLASCLYEAFKETQNSSIISQAITDLVSEDDFETFNRYFERNVGEFSKSLRKVLESRETIEMIQITYKLAKSEMKSINYNALQSTLYYFLLQVKTILLKVDFKELWTTGNQTNFFIQESMWKIETGKLPEMATFVENLLSRTTGSIVFWDHLTGQFLTEMKTKISDTMDEFKDYLTDINTVEDVAKTIVEKLTSIMNMIADGDEEAIRQIFKDIRGSKWDETLTSYIEIIADKLTRRDLSDLASYLPSYDDIKTTITNNHFFQPIKTLLFQDWPQDEIYPASIEDFVKTIYDTRCSIFNSIFGNNPCDDN